MLTNIILSDINHSDDTLSSWVRFGIMVNDTAVAWVDTNVPGHADEGATFQATIRNRIHEITELLDDWIRQDRGIVVA
jgi:hypothetical protein